jgi:ABC-type sugar transport system ATPase subunit
VYPSTLAKASARRAGPAAGHVEVFRELAEITRRCGGAKLGIQVVHQEPKLTNESSIA